jgi:hypothetical protein
LYLFVQQQWLARIAVHAERVMQPPLNAQRNLAQHQNAAAQKSAVLRNATPKGIAVKALAVKRQHLRQLAPAAALRFLSR